MQRTKSISRRGDISNKVDKWHLPCQTSEGEGKPRCSLVYSEPPERGPGADGIGCLGSGRDAGT